MSEQTLVERAERVLRWAKCKMPPFRGIPFRDIEALAEEALAALTPKTISPPVSGDLVERLKKHAYKLPEGYYCDDDHGCNEDDPESLIMSILDSAPQGTDVMQQLTASGYSIVRSDDLSAAIAALSNNDETVTEALKRIKDVCNFGVNAPDEALTEVDRIASEALATRSAAPVRDELREALEAVEPYLDAIVCYASTIAEHDGNRVASKVRAALSQHSGERP